MRRNLLSRHTDFVAMFDCITKNITEMSSIAKFIFWDTSPRLRLNLLKHSIVTAVTTVLNLYVPYATVSATARIFNDPQEESTGLYLFYNFGILWTIGQLVPRVQLYALKNISKDIVITIKRKIIEKILLNPTVGADENSKFEAINHLNQTEFAVEILSTYGFGIVSQGILEAISSLYLLTAFYDLPIGFKLMVVSGGGYTLIRWTYSKLCFHKTIQKIRQRIPVTKAYEILQKVDLVQQLSIQNQEVENCVKSFSEQYNENHTLQERENFQDSLNIIVLGMSLGYIFWDCLRKIKDNHYNRDDFQVILNYLYRLASSLAMFVKQIPFIKKSIGDLSDIKKFLTCNNSSTFFCRKGLAISSQITSLTFKDVFVEYGTKKVLTGVSFNVRAGELVAVMGESAQGKTSLLNCLAGFVTLKRGDILLNRVSFSDYSQDAVSQKLSFLSQKCAVFNETLFDNLQYVSKNISNQDMCSAIDQLGLSYLLDKKNINKRLGENDVSLSAGELQRICLARTMLKDADIYLLDEPTSALDAEIERLAINFIKHRAAHRIVLIVTHHRSLSLLCNRILYVHNGKVSEQQLQLTQNESELKIAY